MTNLSTFERSLIDKVLSLEDAGSLVVMNNILEFSFEDFDHMYIDNIDDCQCTLNVEEHYFTHKEQAGGVQAISELLEGVNKKFLIMSKLFNYLISKNLIIVSAKFDCSFIGTKGNARYITYNNLDLEVANFIWQYCDKRFTPTENLRNFVKNGYKTDEQVALEAQAASIKKTSSHANWALLVSMASLAVSVVVPLFVTAKVELVNKKVNVGISGDISPKISATVFNLPTSSNIKKPTKIKTAKKAITPNNSTNSCSNIVLTEEQFNNLITTLTISRGSKTSEAAVSNTK